MGFFYFANLVRPCFSSDLPKIHLKVLVLCYVTGVGLELRKDEGEGGTD